MIRDRRMQSSVDVASNLARRLSRDTNRAVQVQSVAAKQLRAQLRKKSGIAKQRAVSLLARSKRIEVANSKLIELHSTYGWNSAKWPSEVIRCWRA